MVLASALDNQLNAVVCVVGGQAGRRSPAVATRVVNALGNGSNGDNIGRRAVKENKRDLALSGGFPRDAERLADGDDAVKTGLVDGVTRRVTLRLSVGGSQRGKGGKASGEQSDERHYRVCDVLLFSVYAFLLKMQLSWTCDSVGL